MNQLTKQEIETQVYEFQKLCYPLYSEEEIQYVLVQVLEGLEGIEIESIIELNDYLDKKLPDIFYAEAEKYINRLFRPTEFPYKILLQFVDNISLLQQAVDDSNQKEILEYKEICAQKYLTIFDINMNFYNPFNNEEKLQMDYFVDRFQIYNLQYQKTLKELSK